MVHPTLEWAASITSSVIVNSAGSWSCSWKMVCESWIEILEIAAVCAVSKALERTAAATILTLCELCKQYNKFMFQELLQRAATRHSHKQV